MCNDQKSLAHDSPEGCWTLAGGNTPGYGLVNLRPERAREFLGSPQFKSIHPIQGYSSLLQSIQAFLTTPGGGIRWPSPKMAATPWLASLCQPLPSIASHPPTPYFFHGGCHLQKRYFVRSFGVFAPLREANQ